MSTPTAIPFGVQYLTSPPSTQKQEETLVSYSTALQLNVSAEGNPWHAMAGKPETQSETSNGDGKAPGSDSGTDLY
jgi:putative ATP-grasp target RiPP